MGNTNIALPGATITFGPDFYDPTSYYPTSFSFAQNQEITVLHEFGHALDWADNGALDGTGTLIMPDNGQTLSGQAFSLVQSC
jgi:hypothetical protein